MKTACVYHSRDLDGWMSAAVVKMWFIDNHDEPVVTDDKSNQSFHGEDRLHMIGWDYGQEVPDLSGYDKIIMCDISFPAEVMGTLPAELIWIDHHISAIKEVDAYLEKNRGHFDGLRDPKFAACELTWKYFYPGKDMPEIVRLLGRYDCFGHKGTLEERKVLEFQYGARGSISNYEDAYFDLTNSIKPDGQKVIDGILAAGIPVYEHLCTEAKQIYSNSFEVHFSEPVNVTTVLPGNVSEKHHGMMERKFLCVNRDRFSPENFGINYHKDGYEGFACFWYDGKLWKFSLYNEDGSVDCSAICKTHGGGGHKGAAGFTVDRDSINYFLNQII